MKKLAALTLSLFLTSGAALADTPKDADPQPAKSAQPAKPKAAKKAAKTDASFAAELEELRQTLQSQQEQLTLLREQLAKRDRQIDEAREAAAAANTRAMEASTKAAEAVTTTAEVKTTATSLNSTVSDLKASNEALRTTVSTAAGQAKPEEPPSLRYKGISITPGGFLAAETVFRNRATSGDIPTPFTGIPFSGSGLSKLTEFNGSGRQSRWSLLAEGSIEHVKFTGYYEADFFSAGTTSNNRQTNSYTFRQRQAFLQAALDSGWTFTGGQMWSLITETRKGITNRQEALPQTIDVNYTVGFNYDRGDAFRVVKNFHDKFAFGFAVEGPQTTFGGRGSPTPFFFNAQGSGAGLFNAFDATGYTVNKTPDFVIKLAADPGWGHYEVYGLIVTYRDRVFPCGAVAAGVACGGKVGPSTAGVFNDSRTGGGIGFHARVPLFNKKLDAGLSFLGGDGIGRFGAAQLAGVTARPDGTLAPIRGGQTLGTLDWHATKKLDVYANAGVEYAYRTAYLNAAGTAGVGYGSPRFNNSGCNTETTTLATTATPAGPSASGTCNGDIKDIFEGTLGFWHRFYSGPKGRLQWGLQYSYVLKRTWSGNNNTPTVPGAAPTANVNILFTSFRYYIP